MRELNWSCCWDSFLLRDCKLNSVLTLVISFPHVVNRRRQWQPTLVLLPGESHGRRSLVVCSPWGRKESDTAERLHFHFSLPCTGEGNGNPLQCSYLENPRDGGAWWAAICGVAQSWTRLKWQQQHNVVSTFLCSFKRRKYTCEIKLLLRNPWATLVSLFYLN